MFSTKNTSEKYDYDTVQDFQDLSTVDASTDDQEVQPLFSTSGHRLAASRRSFVFTIWGIVTVGLAIFNVWLYFRVMHLANTPSYENGFLTDLSK